MTARVARAALVAAALLPAAGCTPAAGAAGKPGPAIRVGGPSRPADPKIAVVLDRRKLNGRRFAVLDGGGTVVLRGRLTARGGSPAPWRRAASADLTGVTAPGSYRVRVGKLTSRPWEVRDDASSAPIATILQYFAANADGNEASPAHGPSHLNDGVIASGPDKGKKIDLTGGWMDAGDMIKFTHTTAYAAAALQAAARLDPRDAGALRAQADVGVRWLLKAHPKAGLFIAQVGDGRDHDLGFRDPASDDASGLPGIGTRSAYPGMGGDLAGKAAAALALAAERATGPQRALLIAHARDWYDAGKASASVMPAPAGDFYVSDTWEDAMAAGAAALHRATGEAKYLDDALGYLDAIEPDGRLSWNAMAGFAAADLCGALGAPAAADAAARDKACALLAAQGDAAAAQGANSAFGTPGYIGWGQTGENGGAGALAALAGRTQTAADARDWLLGRNPWGASFVAGFGPKAPRAIHHWASVQGDGVPVGAVVGGPAPRADILAQGFGAPKRSPFNTAAATYEDRRADYVTSEPAIDYAASSILLLAAMQR
jgi:endoglucanase